jgi:hypothetical protein
VGDHWTPYDPPSEFPEGANVHIVEQGDTLWDLAQRYLGDPYLWPQIWERNPYILDSHWIYPGDPVVIDIQVVEEPVVEEVEPEVTEVAEYPVEEFPAEEEGIEEGMPHPLGTAADVYCFALLIEDENIFDYTITSAERIEFQDHFASGDIVYIDGGTEHGVRAGDRFFILERVRPLEHPVSGADMGIVYSQMGQLKVLCAQETTAICEITVACDMVAIGDRLLPYRPIPVPLVLEPVYAERCDLPTGKPVGSVLYVKDDVIEAAGNMLVFVDLGEAEGLYPGQFATLYRDNPTEGMPRMILGEVGLLTVHETYSTGKIVQSWTPVRVGDRVEIK